MTELADAPVRPCSGGMHDLAGAPTILARHLSTMVGEWRRERIQKKKPGGRRCPTRLLAGPPNGQVE